MFLGRFAFDFVTTITTFATLIIVCTTPWVIVMTIGFLVRRGFYLPTDLQVFNRWQRGDAYWFTRGVNWRGMAAWIPAAVVGLLFVNLPGQFEGPLRNTAEDLGLDQLAGVDISLVVVIVLAALLYGLFLVLFPEPRAAEDGQPGGIRPVPLLIGGDRHDQLGARPMLARRFSASAARAASGVGTRFHGRGGHDLIHGGSGHDRIAGGRGHDHLLGNAGHDQLVGGHGHDRINGGRGHDRLHGGHGHDRIIDRHGNTTVVPGPGRNHIDVSDGGTDRVVCHPGSVNRIIGDRGDRLHRHCRNARSTVAYRRPPSEAPTARAAQRFITGDGSNDNPYTTECDGPDNNCVVTSFRSRDLGGLWDNEYVPAYQCPPSHPYLIRKNYAPGGTILPPGVGAVGLGPIGMSIPGIKTAKGLPLVLERYAIGTETGVGASSATNWSFGVNSYQVQLHCSNDDDDGYTR